MYRASALTLIVLLSLCGSSFAQKIERVKPLKSSTGAVLRSLAVPGWGQFYNESYWRSAAFFVSESVMLINISRNSDWMMAAKKTDNFENEQFYRNSRNKLIWWFAAIKLLSIGDAYVGAHLFKLDVSPSLTPEGDSEVQIRATIPF
ncbi:MAG: hypothetical protein IPH10_06845 [bacterium]|nr:hypothetical protein [bacterium]